MKTAFLLVILTMLDNGQMSSAFVNAKSMESCEQKSKIIGAILKKGNADVRTMKCVPSKLEFIKFDHGTAEKAKRQFYAVRLGKDSVTVTRIGGLDACKSAQAAYKDVDEARLYCTSSTQIIK